MKLFELLNFHRELLSRLHACGVRMEDLRYVDLFADYCRMIANGEKVSYSVMVLAGKYDISERKVYSLIKHFQTDCIINSV